MGNATSELKIQITGHKSKGEILDGQKLQRDLEIHEGGQIKFQ